MLETESDFGPAVLWAKGVGYRFADGVWACRGIDFSLHAGEIAVLAGPNGAGKSIFAKQLAGLLEPTEGSVFVHEKEMKQIKGSRATTVGYVFQDARLQTLGETVLEDALFGPSTLGLNQEEALERARAALSECGLAGREGSLVHQLSGGELRLLAIAGVLAMRPEAVILDEPFANLDYLGVKSILRVVRAMAGSGIALLVVTHEIEKILGLAALFSVMAEGRIVLTGKPVEVLAEGIESFGLRDPFKPLRDVQDLAWLD